MRRSTDRLLVSHAGNLPWPDDLNPLLAAGARERIALVGHEIVWAKLKALAAGARLASKALWG